MKPVKSTTLRVNAYRQGRLVTSRPFHSTSLKAAEAHARHIAQMGFVAELTLRHYPATD